MLLDDQNFKNLPPTKIRSPINFLNPRNFLKKSANYFFCFIVKRKCSQLKQKMSANCPKRLVSSVRLFVAKKRKNDWTERAQILCVTSHDSTGEGLWMLKITKMYVQYLFAIVVCYTKRICSCSERWPLLKVEIEDGHEAP